MGTLPVLFFGGLEANRWLDESIEENRKLASQTAESIGLILRHELDTRIAVLRVVAEARLEDFEPAGISARARPGAASDQA
jgi:hypothetical protein